MQKLFANNLLLVSLAALASVVGLVASAKSGDAMWFGRSGSVVTAIGILLVSRQSITGNITPTITSSETGLPLHDPTHYEKLGGPVPQYLQAENKDRLAVNWLGPAVSTCGTLIWGFGDLIQFGV